MLNLIQNFRALAAEAFDSTYFNSYKYYYSI